jgi:hypothetical protein
MAKAKTSASITKIDINILLPARQIPWPATLRRASLACMLLLIVSTNLMPTSALALPSFARQTSMPCTGCHTNFPALNAFGRQFKLNGYLLSSGESKLPPLALMAQGGFTHTDKAQKPKAAPGFDSNDNFALNQASIFYGGIVVPDYVGAFVQGTYDGVEHEFTWDNADLRFAQTTSIAGQDVVYGITANNNPTVSDLWNTTPAWAYPYSTSGLAPAPSAATLIQGGLAQEVVGLGAFGMWNDKVYVELDSYTSLSRSALDALGPDPGDDPEIKDIAPYWRIAGQHDWGNNYLEVGSFGLYAATYPGRDKSEGADHTIDVGFDLQYQYLSDRNDASVLASWILEENDWDASKQLGLTSNSHDSLHSFNLATSYLYDKTYGLTVNYFSIWGDKDEDLYGTRTGSPNSNGFILQLDWLPINKNGGPPFWPYSNVKVSLQYTLYTEFDGSSSNVDGSGRDASDNNTLYLQMWIAF